MTKQEEIREDEARTFYENSDICKTIAWLDLPAETKDSFFHKADNLLYRLHSQGCVLKVDEIKEILPDSAAENVRYQATGNGIFLLSSDRTSSVYKAFKDAGYVAVEPLIMDSHRNTPQTIAQHRQTAFRRLLNAFLPG